MPHILVSCWTRRTGLVSATALFWSSRRALWGLRVSDCICQAGEWPVSRNPKWCSTAVTPGWRLVTVSKGTNVWWALPWIYGKLRFMCFRVSSQIIDITQERTIQNKFLYGDPGLGSSPAPPLVSQCCTKRFSNFSQRAELVPEVFVSPIPACN